MTKEQLVKKWINEVYLDEMDHYTMMAQINKECGFYNWDEDDPRLQKFNSLERRMKRREHRIYAHFGFKRGKVWMCEADYKIMQLLHSFCHDPETLYEMFRIRAEEMLRKDALTLKGWLTEAARNGKSISDVPAVLYRYPEGWHNYISFIWKAFGEGRIQLEDLLNELSGLRNVDRKVKYEPHHSDEKVKKIVTGQLRYLAGFMETLPTAREAHELAEEKRRIRFEKIGIAFYRSEFDEG